MPRPEKADARERKRRKQRKMVIDGRGLLTDAPNWDVRAERERQDRKRKKRKK